MPYLSIKSIILFQIIVIILMTFGILPREFSFVLTAVLFVYILFASIENALFLSIASIPLYIALPISEDFDSMANWRIIIAVLFVKWAIANNLIIYRHSEPKAKNPPRMWGWRIRARFFERSLRSSKAKCSQNDVIKNIKQFLFNPNTRLEVLGLAFLVISFVSLIGASDAGVGIKKILFLVNIFLLYILVKNIANTYEKIISVVKAAVVAIGVTLFIGYGQLLGVFFYSLYDFWQFWAGNIISVFYGDNLSQLLSVSNTWFSYYGNGTPPTLRMFSIFPDSHSFALFNIISIPFLLALMLYYKKDKKFHPYYHFACILTILSLLAIILSGSRGAWVSGMIPLILGILIIGTKKIKIAFTELPGLINQISKISAGGGSAFGGKYQKYISKIKNLFANEIKLVSFSIILFFILFPMSSIILDQSQKAELGRLNNEGIVKNDGVTFKRFATVVDVTETSNKGRLEIWADTLNSIKKHPILGVGLGNFPIVLAQDISAGKKGASAHNIYLDIWAETGILGLMVFLLLFYEIVKTTYRIYKESVELIFKIFAASFGIYLFWILGYGLFDVVLFNDKVLMMFMAGVGVLYGIKNASV